MSTEREKDVKVKLFLYRCQSAILISYARAEILDVSDVNEFCAKLFFATNSRKKQSMSYGTVTETKREKKQNLLFLQHIVDKLLLFVVICG